MDNKLTIDEEGRVLASPTSVSTKVFRDVPRCPWGIPLPCPACGSGCYTLGFVTIKELSYAPKRTAEAVNYPVQAKAAESFRSFEGGIDISIGEACIGVWVDEIFINSNEEFEAARKFFEKPQTYYFNEQSKREIKSFQDKINSFVYSYDLLDAFRQKARIAREDRAKARRYTNQARAARRKSRARKVRN